MHFRGKPDLKRKIIAAIGVFAALLSPAHAQTASWKVYKGALYSFRYPADWKLTVRSDQLVSLQAPAPNSLQIEVEYSTRFGGDPEKQLAAERADLEAAARDAGFAADLQSTEPGYRGGRAMWGTLTTPQGAALTVAVNAIPFGAGIAVTRMLTLIGLSYTNNEQYFQPLMASLSIDPGSIFVGKWSNETLSNGLVNGDANSPLPLERFAASLTCLSGGKYAYTVRQIEPGGPVWELNVQGRYTATARQGSDIVTAELSLIPESSQVIAPGLSNAEKTVQLLRITADGLPNNGRQSFDVHWDANGSAWLKRQGPPAEFVPMVVFSRGSLRAVSAASGLEGEFAPGAVVAFLGNNLSSVTQSQPTTPLPLSMGGVTVTFNQKNIPLFLVSPAMVVAQVPVDAPIGTSIARLFVDGKLAGEVTLSIQKTAPALFLDNEGRAFANNDTGTQNSPSNPARAGSTLTVYYTGQGEFDLPVETGYPAPASPQPRVLASASATIGGKPALVDANVATPDAVGIAQINLLIPAGLAKGDYPVILTIGGVASSAGKISLTP